MSSRIACWLHGHQWRKPGARRYSDLFGNLWRFQVCNQCLARRRVLARAWHEADDDGR